MKKSILFLASFLLFVIIVPQYSFADYHAVLGATDQKVVMQPTTEGPGVLLPDSPLFFLDNFKQQVRLTFAFTDEQKAQVYTNIAGERLAELRFELAKGNMKAMQVDFDGVRDNTRLAAESLARADLAGNNVAATARSLNRIFGERQVILDDLEEQTTGELRADIAVIQAVLTASKVKIEDTLPQEELAKAIQDDLVRQANRLATTTGDTAKQLQLSLQALQEQASDAAKNNQFNRQTAINQAIQDKNKELRKVEDAKILAEGKKAEEKYKLQSTAVAQAETIIKNAQETAKTLQASQQL